MLEQEGSNAGVLSARHDAHLLNQKQTSAQPAFDLAGRQRNGAALFKRQDASEGGCRGEESNPANGSSERPRLVPRGCREALDKNGRRRFDVSGPYVSEAETVGRIHAYPPRTLRAMTMRWIWLVPS